MRSLRRASALGTVLMVAALALLAGLTAAAASTAHLNLAQRTQNGMIARDLAESALAQATAQIMGNLRWTGTVSVDHLPGLPEDAYGRLTFDRSQPVFCTNNFDGAQPVGWQRAVPPQKIHLVATGHCGDVTRRIESMLHVPEFPVSTASDGHIELKNSLVAGFKDETQVSVQNGVVTYDEDELAPGDICTNSDAANSVVLDSQSQVTGDIQTRGRAVVNQARVGGEVRELYNEVFKLPNMRITDYDPGADPNVYCEELAPGSYSTQTLTGTTRYAGSVTINGDMNLDNAMVYVNGSCTINGGLSGQGALFVTGTTTVKGRVSVSSNDNVALFGQGNVSLLGEGSSTSIFQGLVYTRGNFVARQITVVGSFIAESSGGVGGGATLEDAHMFYAGAPANSMFRREVQVVLPRWTPDAGRTNFTVAPSGFAYGAGLGPVAGRTVDSVMAPEGEPSNWEANDPFVLRGINVNGQVLYQSGFRGRDYDGNPMPASWSPLVPRADILAHVLAGVYDNAYALENMAEDIPARSVYEANLNQTLDAMSQRLSSDAAPSWGLAPNRFLTESDKLRQLFRSDLL